MRIIDVEKMWDLKTEAHNSMVNYLESKGLDDNELLEFVKLLSEYSKCAIKLSNHL
ncbi:hypothetical protein LGK97_19285 [Clostridium sp. CS001]|uniref:hypothetical protein n=1 Tax=Clostridium sp. CS001 TaxID=2880648 RepID=UPI001CF172C9|nr:hypothetical protein [Clostridium sp. CS001]MCB2291851.1 hypothetical protein [Clostridium sp. CS001]